MANESTMPLRLVVKLASLVIHVQEMDPTTDDTLVFDLPAAKNLANDPEVAEWLATLDPAFLPEKRG